MIKTQTDVQFTPVVRLNASDKWGRSAVEHQPAAGVARDGEHGCRSKYTQDQPSNRRVRRLIVSIPVHVSLIPIDPSLLAIPGIVCKDNACVSTVVVGR